MTAPRVRIMGIINATPDSFSGDGVLKHADYVGAAVEQAARMIAEGADLLDVGGESSRPGATPVSAEEEKRRVVPVIAAIRAKFPSLLIAVDTVKAEVAEEAIRAGASMINDISALGDAAMPALAARTGVHVVLMHNRADPKAVEDKSYAATSYQDVVEDVANDLKARIDFAKQAGIAASKIIVDPGIGFGKTPEQSLELICNAGLLKQRLGIPVLLGYSRKSFLSKLEGFASPEAAAAAVNRMAVDNGADIVRVHDVKEMAQTIKRAAA